MKRRSALEYCWSDSDRDRCRFQLSHSRWQVRGGSLPVTLTYITTQHIELVMSLVSVSELPLEVLERILLPLHPTVILKMKEVSSTT